MTSVTVAGIQGIIRPLRNRAGQYLFVLTSDYEQIDFVLLQRVTPEGEGKGLTQKQVGVRPRVLTVDRRNPDPVALRVLRRFSYTELDPFAQFDKLVSAFGVAEWSEPLFNNRALFSDYYLKFRLPDDSAWKDDPKPAYQKFLSLFAQAPRRWGGQSIKEVSEACWSRLSCCSDSASKKIREIPKAHQTLTTTCTIPKIRMANPWPFV